MGAKKSKQAGGTGAEALTYAERRALGHGTLSERLGRDSIGDWRDCRLTLSNCVGRDPVCTPRGFLFSREAIVRNLLEQKRAAKRALAEWESARERRREAEEARRDAEAEREALAFERRVNAGSASGTSDVGRQQQRQQQQQQQRHQNAIVGSSTIPANRERGATANNAWGTSAGAIAAAEASARRAAELRDAREAADAARPDAGATRCPASGEKLRLKDLVSVKFYRPGEEEEEEGEDDEGKGAAAAGAASAKKRKALSFAPSSSSSSSADDLLAFDPVTREPLTNSTSVVVLLPSGWAMSEASYETCVKPDGTWNGKPVERVIKLQRGGTGFVAHDGKAAEAASHFALGAGSGRADVRGQLAAGGSRFGLKYTN